MEVNLLLKQPKKLELIIIRSALMTSKGPFMSYAREYKQSPLSVICLEAYKYRPWTGRNGAGSVEQISLQFKSGL